MGISMLFTAQPLDYVNVRSCGSYYPYPLQLQRGIRDRLSCQMMDFKNPDCAGHNAAIPVFTDLLVGELERIRYPNPTIRLVDNLVQVAIIPSHRAGRVSAALQQVVSTLVARYRGFSSELLLERIVDVPSAHEENGNRSIPHHMGTIRVITRNLRPQLPIILLDDVTTTGGSMSACYHLLRQAGATAIFPIALLETVNS